MFPYKLKAQQQNTRAMGKLRGTCCRPGFGASGPGIGASLDRSILSMESSHQAFKDQPLFPGLLFTEKPNSAPTNGWLLAPFWFSIETPTTAGSTIWRSSTPAQAMVAKVAAERFTQQGPADAPGALRPPKSPVVLSSPHPFRGGTWGVGCSHYLGGRGAQPKVDYPKGRLEPRNVGVIACGTHLNP